jgi:hypothetical protein
MDFGVVQLIYIRRTDMRFIATLFIVALPLVCGNADQIPLELTSTSSAEDGVTATIHNLSDSPVTALLISSTYFEPSGKIRAINYRYEDVYVNFHSDSALLPGATRFMTLVQSGKLASSLSTGARFEVRLEGALFANGTATGTEAGKRILIGRRLRIANDLSAALWSVRRLRNHQVSREELIKEMNAVNLALKAEGESTSDQPTRAILMIGTLVPTWIASFLDNPEASCGSACLEATVDQVESRLSDWQSHLAKGISGRINH